MRSCILPIRNEKDLAEVPQSVKVRIEHIVKETYLKILLLNFNELFMFLLE